MIFDVILPFLRPIESLIKDHLRNHDQWTRVRLALSGMASRSL
jgi:hypothetical protein